MNTSAPAARLVVSLVAAAFAATLPAPSCLATQPARSRLLTGSIAEPVCIAAIPGDVRHIAVCQRIGVIFIVDTLSGALAPSPMLDIRSIVSDIGDGGLLGLAFDPQYAANRLIYIFYNNLADNDRVLARYHVGPGLIAEPASATTLWKFPRSIGHNGGWIGFSPVNGLLYLSMGDGGNSFSFDAPNRAQTITNMLMGKMLRIDVQGVVPGGIGDDFPADGERNYRVPASNPFVGITGDDEIWALGLRNPWRCSFDSATGDLYIADVGQDQREEIDRESPSSIGGRNYGWRCMEAALCTGLGGCTCFAPELTAPIHEYDHDMGVSITGGYVYRGAAIPEFAGLYFYADFSVPHIWTLRPDATSVTEVTDRSGELNVGEAAGQVQFIGCFGEDAAGELYMGDYLGGKVWAIVPFACAADFNDNGGVTVQDIFDFLSAYFTAAPRADFNGVGGITVQDIFDYLSAYFAGC